MTEPKQQPTPTRCEHKDLGSFIGNTTLRMCQTCRKAMPSSDVFRAGKDIWERAR